MACNIGITLQSTVGASYTYFKGVKKDYCADSTNTISDHDYVIGAGENLCLAGGIEVPKRSKVPDRNTVVNLTEDYLDLVAGEKKSLASQHAASFLASHQKVLVAAAIVTALLSTAAVVTTSFMGQQKNDNSQGVWAPKEYQITTGALAALNLLASILLAKALYDNNKAEFKPLKHQPGEIYSTVSLEAKKGNVVVGARETVWIDAKKILIHTFNGSDAVKAELSIDDTGKITIHSKGDLNVVSEAGLNLKSKGDLKLIAPNVKIAGALKINGQDVDIPPGSIQPIPPLTTPAKPQYKNARP